MNVFLTHLNLLLELVNLFNQVCFDFPKLLQLLAVIRKDILLQEFALCLELLLNGRNLGLCLVLDGHPLHSKVFLKFISKF